MDRNTVKAFILIALVLILTPYYFDFFVPPQESSPGPTATPERIVKPLAPPPKEVQTSDKINVETDLDALSVPEKYITVTNDLFRARLSSRNGGSISAFTLLGYSYNDNGLVNLINGTNRKNLLIESVSIDGEPLKLDHSWSLEGRDTLYDATYEERRVRFTTTVFGKSIYKTFIFSPGSYLIGIDIDLSSLRGFLLQDSYSLSWEGGLPSTEANKKDDLVYFKGYAFQGGELHDLNLKNGKSKEDKYLGQTAWVATRTKYFLAALISPSGAFGAELGGSQSKDGIKAYDVALLQRAEVPSHVDLYLGPLEYSRIKRLGVELDKVMNFGLVFIRPIAKGVLWVLKAMHSAIPNYGIVLVIFSILIKILVYPLTKKSYQSTREMQAVQPQIAALKEKYKANPKKLNQATMALYKEHGVNPLGGCLPMLLQMPLLFSLFTVFRTTIELRGEPFVFWIKDLSAPDTIFYLPFTIPIYGDQVSVLPILMVVSMFIQQRMTGAQMQGQQKFMSYFMTGFFFLLFNGFPSGLNLYYTLFNVLSILQQKYLTPHHPPPAPAPISGKKRRKK